MTWFSWKQRKEPEFLYKSVQGYLHKGKVPQLMADGWELVSADPVMLNGFNMPKQKIITLRKKNPKFVPEPVAHS